MRKYIIDTDIADDVDDAFAIGLAVKLNLDILGITTVFGDTVSRAKYTKSLLKSLNADIPVYVGSKNGLSEFAPTYHSKQLDESESFKNEKPTSENEEDAIGFLIDSALKYGEDLTVIGLGAFTNLAKALTKNEKAFGKVHFVIMGGAYFMQYTDWNVLCDVKSAEILFDKAKNLLCVGADCTHGLAVTERDLDGFFAKESEFSSLMKTAVDLWRNNDKTCAVVLHDPLAVYTAVNTDLVEITDAFIKVVTDGDFMGETLNLLATGKQKILNVNVEKYDKVKVCKSVKKEEFIKKFFEII